MYICRIIDNPFGDHRRPLQIWLVGLWQGDCGVKEMHLEGLGSHPGSILGVVKAVLGGYVVHLGPQKGHVADLGSHFVVKKSYQEPT